MNIVVLNAYRGISCCVYMILLLLVACNKNNDDPVSPPPDPPFSSYVIHDLEVVDSTYTSITLQWTSIPKATTYDLRYLLVDIDRNNWDSGIVCPNLPAPAPAGSLQTYTLENLIPNQTYSFSILGYDLEGDTTEFPDFSEEGNTKSYFIFNKFYSVSGDALSIFDIDKDHDSDIVVTTDYIRILTNDGNGVFTSPGKSPKQYSAICDESLLSNSVLAQNSTQTINDFDNDGNLDIATSGSQSDLRIHLNNGSGDFSSSIDYTESLSNPSWICSQDFNDDDIVDISASFNLTDQIAVLFGKGDAEFEEPTYYECGLSPQCIMPADLNDDGHFDLVVTNMRSNNVSVFINSGNGTFSSSVYYYIGQNPLQIALSDLDNDNDIDITVAVSGPPAGVAILLNSGDGTFPQEAILYSAGRAPKSIDIADIDNDGYEDIIVTNGLTVDYIATLLNQQDGTYKEPFYTHISIPEFVRTGDLDSDGDIDLIAIIENRSIVIYLNSIIE